MRILLLGADGQLGHELRRCLAPLGELVASTLSGHLPDGSACEAADFSRPDSLPALIDRIAPDLVVNAAAYTAVDKAEDEPELAFRINAEAVAAIAQACAKRDAELVHYSTDYVFAGCSTRPYREDDLPGPLGVYGASKWAGEQAVRDSGVRHKLFRLCWVYGVHGHNFMKTMLRLASERDELRVVADQVGTPTPAHWIADITVAALQRGKDRQGTWHVAAGGETSWHGFAEAIVARGHALALLPRVIPITAITTGDYPTRAQRPAYSRMDTSALATDFGLELQDWRDGLDQVLSALHRVAR